MHSVRQSKAASEAFDVPSLHPVALRAMQIISDKNSCIEELRSVIALDPSFTARLLRIANAPYYRRSAAISSVDEAIVLIGLTTVKSLIVLAALKDIHQQTDSVGQDIWEHSVGVAVAAMLVSDETDILSSEEALVPALLHDIGKIVLNRTWSEKYAQVVALVSTSSVDFPEAEEHVFGFNHCDVGEQVAECWHLPAHLAFPITHHHAAVPLSGPSPMIPLIKAAHLLCTLNRIGLGSSGIPAQKDLEFLGLDAVRIEHLSGRLAVKYPLYKDFLRGTS